MYYIYVLESLNSGRYYIGYTSNIEQRIGVHNKGKNKSTKSSRPWKLIYKEEYGTQKDAIRREKELKSWKKRSRIRNMIYSKPRGRAVAAR